jgi:hypothetical protein
MQIKTIKKNDIEIASVNSEEILISDVQSALDFMATVQYEAGCNRIILNKPAIVEDFFHLSTKIAGEILQKFVNYRVKFAIIGDFSAYTSVSMKAFILECNRGKDIFFLPDEEKAVEKLSTV